MKHGGGERSKGQKGKYKWKHAQSWGNKKTKIPIKKIKKTKNNHPYSKPMKPTFHVDARPGAAAC